MKREIIKIDEELCDGCGLCIPNCHEGALQIIDGKARLVSDLMCDGLGACLGHCPVDAITIEEREAEPYDEIKVMSEIAKQGKNVVIAHLKHLKDHDEKAFLKQGIEYLEQHENELNLNIMEIINEVHGENNQHNHHHSSCPGSREMSFAASNKLTPVDPNELKSELRQWPVQMHLLNPNAPYFRGADVVIAADCVAFALGNFHQKYLKGKSVGIACPKLDSETEVYVEKFTIMIDQAQINTLTVMIMEVPCCGGLLQMIKMAAGKAERKVPVKLIIVGIQGDILQEQWI